MTSVDGVIADRVRGWTRRALAFLFLLIAAIPQVPDHASLGGASLSWPYRFKVFGVASPIDCLFVLLVAVALATEFASWRSPLVPNRVTLLFLGFAAVTVVALYRGLDAGHDPRFAVHELVNLNRVFVVYVAAGLLLADAVARAWLGQGIFVIAGGYGVLGAVKYALGHGVDLHHAGERVPLYDSGAHVIIVIACLGFIEMASRDGLRGPRLWLGGLWLTPALWVFIASLRRGLWVAFALGLLVMVLAATGGDRRPVMRALAATIAAIVVVLGLALGFSSQMRETISFSVTKVGDVLAATDSSVNFRIVDARNALAEIAEHPIGGIGLGGFYPIRFGRPGWFAYRVARLNSAVHNTYLYIPLKVGIPGSLLFFAALASIALGAVRILRSPVPPPRFAITAASFFIGYAVFLATAPGILFLAHATALGVAMAWIDAADSRSCR